MRATVKTGLTICLNAIFVMAIISYLLYTFPTLFSRFNDIVYDFWLINSDTKVAQNGPIVIDIDERSMKEIGQLPWPRSILADLVTNLLQNGAKAIGLDIWLTEPDRSSPIAVDSLLEKNFGINLDLSKIPILALDNDRYLRNAIAGKPVVLGGLASFTNMAPMPDNLPEPLQFTGDKTKIAEVVPEADGFIPPIPILAEAAPVGLMNVSSKNDAIIRNMPLLAKIGDELYPGLSLLTLMTALGQKEAKIDTNENGIETIHIGDIKIPVDNDGSFRPNYRGNARTLPYISAIDVLNGNVGRKELEGRIVFVGPSAHSLLDLRSTPYGSAMPGAEIHATILDNILAGAYVRSPNHEKIIIYSLILATCILGVVSYQIFHLVVYALITFILLIFFIAGSWILFQHGIFISPIAPISTLILSAFITLPMRYWRDQMEKWKLKRAFNHYVSPEIVTQIVNGGEKLLKGEYKNITIMFTDVRKFTEISEKLTPAQLVNLLNIYFTPMTACIIARNGTLDKFIGDALMAFWNAPLDIYNHPYEAVNAAIEMQAALAALRPDIKRDFDINLQMGIGIHTGMAHIGNMGSKDLLDYTCIGENVNLASRLESMCKRYGMNIIISETVKNACSESLRFLLLDRIRVKGSAKPLQIYTPLSNSLTLKDSEIEGWQNALDEYFNGSFEKAELQFLKLSQIDILKTACELFIQRCMQLSQHPLEKWQGIWVYQEK